MENQGEALQGHDGDVDAEEQGAADDERRDERYERAFQLRLPDVRGTTRRRSRGRRLRR